MFIDYITHYCRDIEIVAKIKNEDISSQDFARQVFNDKIGFETYHYLLKKESTTLLLLNILWKLLRDKKEVEIYEYIIEVISNQLFKEYLFVTESLQFFLNQVQNEGV